MRKIKTFSNIPTYNNIDEYVNIYLENIRAKLIDIKIPITANGYFCGWVTIIYEEGAY